MSLLSATESYFNVFFSYRYPLGIGTDLTFNYSAPTNELAMVETFRYA